jgi:hypothetical protein
MQSDLCRGFLTEALSFSPLCGLLIGHQVVCVDARFLMFTRWQQTAADRSVAETETQLLFLISFYYNLFCTVCTQSVQQSVWEFSCTSRGNNERLQILETPFVSVYYLE